MNQRATLDQLLNQTCLTAILEDLVSLCNQRAIRLQGAAQQTLSNAWYNAARGLDTAIAAVPDPEQ